MSYRKTQRNKSVKSGKQYTTKNEKFNKEIEIKERTKHIPELKDSMNEVKNSIERINITVN